MPIEPILEAPLDAFGEVNINVIKLQPMVCAVNRRGLLFCVDNKQVVTMISAGWSRNHYCMNWLRELFWLSFIFYFLFLVR